MLRARLLDDDLAVALEDLRLDLADVLVDQGLDRLLAGQDRAARASFTQVGQSESVVRGQPSGGLVRSWLFISGAGAHLGWNVPDSMRRLTA